MRSLIVLHGGTTMDRMITAFLAGKNRPLHYSIDVMFSVNEKYGDINELLTLISSDTKESFGYLRDLAVMMANDAELCRRAEGYDKEEMLDKKQVTLQMRPAEYLNLKAAVSQTIELGYMQEHQSEDEETDLGLAELRKKAEAGD